MDQSPAKSSYNGSLSHNKQLFSYKSITTKDSDASLRFRKQPTLSKAQKQIINQSKSLNTSIIAPPEEAHEIKFNFDVQPSAIFDTPVNKSNSNYKLKDHKIQPTLPLIAKNMGTISYLDRVSDPSTKLTTSLTRSQFQSPPEKVESPSRLTLKSIIQSSDNKDGLVMDVDTRRVLEQLRERKCTENIQKYKNEIETMKYLLNPYNQVISHSNIEKKILQLQTQNEQMDATHKDFHNLREYLRLYKQRLYLIPRHQLMEEDQDSRGMDFNTYKDLKTKQHNFLDVIKEHMQDSEDLLQKMGVLENIKTRNSVFFKKQKEFQSNKEPKLNLSLDQIGNSKLTKSKNKGRLSKFRSPAPLQSSLLNSSRKDYQMYLQQQEEQAINKVAQEIESKYFRAKECQKQKKMEIVKMQTQQLLQSQQISYQQSPLGQNPYGNIMGSRNLWRDKNKGHLYHSVDAQHTTKNQEHRSSLTDIFKSCKDLKVQNSKIGKRYKQSHKDFNRDLSSCKHMINESQNHLSDRSIEFEDDETIENRRYYGYFRKNMINLSKENNDLKID